MVEFYTFAPSTLHAFALVALPENVRAESAPPGCYSNRRGSNIIVCQTRVEATSLRDSLMPAAREAAINRYFASEEWLSRGWYSQQLLELVRVTGGTKGKRPQLIDRDLVAGALCLTISE
jgi:hypothetical protein